MNIGIQKEDEMKAILFEWDLTLVNSLKVNLISYKAVCKEVRAKPTRKEFRGFIGTSVTNNVKYFSEKYDYKKDLRKTMNSAFMKNLDKIKVYDKSITNKLMKKGIKIGIITGNSEAIVKAIAKKHKIKYDALIGDETTKGKEKVWAIKQMLKRFKVSKKDAVYAGDHINDVIQAHKAGIKAVIIPSRMNRKSYLNKFSPEYILKSLKEVMKL